MSGRDSTAVYIKPIIDAQDHDMIFQPPCIIDVKKGMAMGFYILQRVEYHLAAAVLKTLEKALQLSGISKSGVRIVFYKRSDAIAFKSIQTVCSVIVCTVGRVHFDEGIPRR